MVQDEDYRTAVFGKTERTVGWEGNGEPVMIELLRYCRWGNPQQTDKPYLLPLSHFFTLDMLFLTNRDAEWAMERLRGILARLELELNEEKSRVVDAEKETLQDELESTSGILSVLESELEEATTSMSSLEDQLSSAVTDIDDLEGQIESLEGEVASRLTYMTSGIIAVVVAIMFGVVGFLAAKRT